MEVFAKCCQNERGNFQKQWDNLLAPRIQRVFGNCLVVEKSKLGRLLLAMGILGPDFFWRNCITLPLPERIILFLLSLLILILLMEKVISIITTFFVIIKCIVIFFHF